MGEKTLQPAGGRAERGPVGELGHCRQPMVFIRGGVGGTPSDDDVHGEQDAPGDERILDPPATSFLHVLDEQQRIHEGEHGDVNSEQPGLAEPDHRVRGEGDRGIAGSQEEIVDGSGVDDRDGEQFETAQHRQQCVYAEVVDDAAGTKRVRDDEARQGPDRPHRPGRVASRDVDACQPSTDPCGQEGVCPQEVLPGEGQANMEKERCPFPRADRETRGWSDRSAG